MSVVGRAYVTVRAVTRQVPGDIESGVQGALDKLDDKIGQKLGDKLGQDMGKGVAGSGVDKSISDSVNKYDTDSDGNALGQKLGSALKRGVASVGVSKAFEEETKKYDYDTDGSRIGARLGDAIGRSLFGSGKIKSALHKALTPDSSTDHDAMDFGDRVATMIAAGLVLKSPRILMSSMLLPLAQEAIPALSGLTAAATALASTLGPTLAAGAAVGGSAMAGLLTTVGTVTLAFKMNKDAVADLVGQLAPVRAQWEGIASDLQRRLFPALEGAATRMSSALGPVVRQGLLDTAGAVGSVANQFARLAESSDFRLNLSVLMQSNASALRLFGGAGADAADILVRLGAAAAPVTQRFAEFVRTQMDSARSSLANAQATGQLDAFFQRAADTTAKWGSVLGNTGSALGHIFSLGSSAGGQLLDMLERVTQQFNDWTRSASGEASITRWFQSAVPIARDFGDVIDGLMVGLGNFADEGQGLHGVLQAIAQSLPSIGTALGGFSASLGGVSKVLPTVAEGLGNLGEQWGKTGQELWNSLAPAVRDVVPALVSIGNAALRVVADFAPTFEVVGKVAQVVGAVLAPALTGVAEVLDRIPGPIMGVVGALILLRVGLNQVSQSRFAPAMNAVGQSLARIGGQMVTAGGAAAAFKVGMGGLVSALGGPWGIAITAAITGLGIWASRNAEAKAEVEALTSTLDKNTGALTRNTRESVANALEKSGALAAAQALGISLSDVTDAALGNAAANQRVRESLAGISGTEFESLGRGAHGAAVAQDEVLGNVTKVTNAIGGQNDRVNDAIGRWDRLHQATSRANQVTQTATGTYRSAEVATGRFGRTTDGVASSLQKQTRDQQALTRATYAYHDATIKAMQGNIGLEQAIDDARKTIQSNTKTLNIGTQAGRDNKLALIQIAVAANQVTGSATKQQAALEKARQKIIAYAEMLGLGHDRAAALADKLIGLTNSINNVPRGHDTKINTPGLDSAITNVRNYRQYLENLPQNIWTNIWQTTHKSTTAERGTGTGGGMGRAPSSLGPRRAIAGGTRGPGGGGTLLMPGGSDTTSNAARVAAAAGGTVIEHRETYNYNVTVNNPQNERTSDSIPRALRRTRDLGLTAGDR